MLILMLFLARPAQADSPTPDFNEGDSPHIVLETREPRWSLPIYRQPDTRSPVRGRLLKDEAFHVLERVEGRGCSGEEGWARLQGDGYVCLDKTRPSSGQPIALPRLTTFDHPETDEYWDYLETGEYDRQELSAEDSLVPFVYAKPWKRWSAPSWQSLWAWNAGRAANENLSTESKYHFKEVIETERGTVLKHSSGVVVPVDRIFIYPVSRFHGRDLIARPVGEGMLPAWVHGYDGGPVYATPDDTGEPALVLPYHQELAVRSEPVDKEGHWWEIPDALGAGRPGYVHDEVAVRHWVPRPAPEEIESDEVWIDIDRGQQILALRKGDDVLFMTLVSTGKKRKYTTPSGMYRVMSKTVHTDMRSKPDSDQPYHVEKVPWAASFWTRYALHGTYWHWGFGNSASRGCINLSPRDAKYIFDRLHPLLPDGWGTVYETPQDPGMVLRVRLGADEELKDRRRLLHDDRQVSR